MLFEALVMTLGKEMPVHAMARLLKEHGNRIWRIIHFHIERARATEDFSQVRRLGVDETSRRRGHHYVSLFVDLDRPRAIFCTDGRDAESFGRLTADSEARAGSRRSSRSCAWTWRRAIAWAPPGTWPTCRSRSIAIT